MTALEKLFVVKCAGSLAPSALPGSTLKQTFGDFQKTVGKVKPMKPVVSKGVNQSGMAQTKPEKIV